MIKELLELTRENNSILRDMRRRERVASVFRLLYWGLIIASMYGAYVYVQPYLDSVVGNIDKIQSTATEVKTLSDKLQTTPSAEGLQQFLDFIKEMK